MAASASLTPQAGREFALRWFDRTWNRNGAKAVEEQCQAIDEMCDPALEVFGFPDPSGATNVAGFKAGCCSFREAFSDISVSVVQTITEGDRVCVHWKGMMKHTGPGLKFTATNESISFEGVSISQMRDGKVLRSWNFMDITREIARLKELAEAHLQRQPKPQIAGNKKKGKKKKLLVVS